MSILLDTVSKFTKMTHVKNDHWLGLCPFHDEKTASFRVDASTDSYHCFGCGAHGISGMQFLTAYEASQEKKAKGIEDPKEPITLEDRKNSYKMLCKILESLKEKAIQSANTAVNDVNDYEKLDAYLKKIAKELLNEM